MAIPVRGVKEIRTQLGRNGGKREPYQLFMEISALERERSRREKERITAIQQVTKIEARFAEIEATRARLLSEATEGLVAGPAGPADRRAAAKARRDAVIARTPSTASGFKIKY